MRHSIRAQRGRARSALFSRVRVKFKIGRRLFKKFGKFEERSSKFLEILFEAAKLVKKPGLQELHLNQFL